MRIIEELHRLIIEMKQLGYHPNEAMALSKIAGIKRPSQEQIEAACRKLREQIDFGKTCIKIVTDIK